MIYNIVPTRQVVVGVNAETSEAAMNQFIGSFKPNTLEHFLKAVPADKGTPESHLDLRDLALNEVDFRGIRDEVAEEAIDYIKSNLNLMRILQTVVDEAIDQVIE